MLQDTLHAAVTVPAPTIPWRELLLPLLPLLQAQLTVPLVEAIKRLNAWTNTRPAWQKQFLVLAINTAFAIIGVALGVKIEGIDNVTTATAGALIGSALSLAAHAGRAAHENKVEIKRVVEATQSFPVATKDAP